MMQVIIRKKKPSAGETAAQVILHIFTWSIVLFTLMPLLLTIMLSLKNAADFQRGMLTIPKTLAFSNYSYCWEILNVNMINSLIACVAITFGAVFISSFSAYLFARYDFPFKNFLYSLILALMMVPGVLTMTSSYLNVQKLGLYNTRWAIILPGIASNLVGSVFLFRTFMGQQPKSVFESAHMDGAGDWAMYLHICLPMSVPVIMIQSVGIFAGQYNDYLWPMLVVENSKIQNLMPLLKDLANDLSVRHSNEGLSYALYLCSGIPLIVTSAVGLKYCINGDFAAGLKL